MLTELGVRKLTAKGGQRVEIWDEKIPGFGLRVAPSGTKSFVIMYYAAGRKRRLTLGRYPVLSLVDARRRALETLVKVASGSDPKGGEPASTLRYRFTDMVGEFVEAHCARHNRENHARETERILRSRFADAWSNRDIREIAKADVLKILDGAVRAGTPSAANHALAAIRKFYSWAVERGLVDANPCAGISRPASAVARERVLSSQELLAVWKGCEANPTPFAQIVQLLMLTAQRRGEVVGMRWSEIDWRAQSWSIPASRTKSNRAQVVPLSTLATSVLNAVSRINDELVFPARGNEDTTTSGFSKMKRQLDGRSQVSDWTLHDLRRSAATHMASLGVAPHVIERILNHTTGTFRGVAGIYNRFQYLPEMRAALELWAEHIGKLEDTETHSAT